MTKPQFASEPSMEDILASIRKMISDDRSPTRPRPDPMTRTPFAEVSSPAPVEPGATAATVARSGPSYGSLSEAIKAAAQPADQRRTLEERITDLLEKGGTGSADPLAALAHRAQPAPAAPSRPSAPAASLPSQSASSSAADSALPFGTRAPQAPIAAPAVTSAKTAAPETKAEPQRVIAMPSRYPSAPATSTPAPAANGQLNGTSAASFGSRVGTNGAQPVRATPPAEEPVLARAAIPAAEPALDTLKAYHPAPADVVKAAIGEPAPAATAPAAPSEALVDAMIELVKNEPASLSVFTSGAAFMRGVSDKGIGVEKSLAAHKQAPAAAPAHSDDGAPELDGAAAELLRPMLRQWLAENMPRIVEAALRSEITSGGKGPGKA